MSDETPPRADGGTTDGDSLETILEAAILHEGACVSVPRPGRHHDVIRQIAGTLPAGGHVHGVQGFLTSRGRFVGRKEAGRIALAAGQTPALRWGTRLFSEDLW